MLKLPQDAGPPPEEALEFFKAKELRPAFSYRDVWRQEHDTAFTVAKVLERDLLADIQKSLADALANGTTFEAWAQGIRGTFEQSGWADYGTEAQTPRRLKTIFDTNMRMARAVGQEERIQRTKRALPYLAYELGPSRVHRDEHVGWEGTVLPVDDPWWQTHSPPLGYGCRCWRRQLTRSQAEELGISEPPEEQLVDWTDPRTGETEQVPAGVDPSFAYPRTQAAREQALEAQLDEAPTAEETAPPVELGDEVPASYWDDPTAPDGAFDAGEFRQAVNASIADPQEATAVRRQLDDLLAELGMVSRDILNEGAGRDQVRFRDLGGRAAGYHHQDGAIELDVNHVGSLLRFAKDLQERGREAFVAFNPDDYYGAHVLVHEAVHGHSPKGARACDGTMGAALEEATTEIATGVALGKLTGADPERWTSSYEEYRAALQRAVEAVSFGVPPAEVAEQIRAASVEMRRTARVFDSPYEYASYFASKLPNRYGREVAAVWNDPQTSDAERATAARRFVFEFEEAVQKMRGWVP